ncbi:chitin synthase activator [Colletotrichum tofieldiae]|nr:chitin synthase activator [Colletotrichum tofieldiae]
MPVNDGSQRRPPPPRMDPYGGPGGPPRNGVPPRPSTAQGNRPPPQRMYPPNQMPPPQQQQQHHHQHPPPQHGGYGGEYDGGQDAYRDTRASFGDVYDAYYHSTRMSNQSNASYAQHDVPDFNAAPSNGPRGSFDQHIRPGIAEQTQPGAKRVPEMSRTKSQPDLRQSQQAVFEMAGDAPPMPPMGNGYQDAYGANGWDQPQNPQMGRPALPQGPSPGRGPDSLPSHPAPVRPGHMPNSMVNMSDKPAPIRNYSGASNVPTPPAGPGGAPPPQQQMLPQQPSNSSAQDITTPVTQEELERLRQIIKTNPNDQESAMRLAKRLVEAADVLAPALADPKMRARGRERYLADASKILKKLSGAQNPEAMFFHADCLGRGLFGLEPDNKEAFTLYQSAAKLGHAAAAYRTAVCCEIGHEEGGGTRKDPLKAIQWYKRAATLGDTPAMYKVGMILLKGLLGQPKNPREAVGWLKRAAERADAENPHALHELGLLYESAAPNDAIIKDEAYAFTLFRQAADLGYKFSQYRLGCAFEYGLMGCPVDPRQSIMWYSRAAQQGEHQAELSLSGWYLTGSDTVLQQSDTEAYLWARKAATAGLAKAEYAMGYFTEVGIGVPANMEDAKRWYWRAAAQDFPKARERLEDLKRAGKNGPRQRERISRSKIGKQQEGECSVM